MDNIYIARQPILDKNNETFAYELLYRDDKSKANIINSRLATVAVLSSTLNKFGIKNLLGDKKAFIKADEQFLLHEVIFTIPKEHFIFSLQLKGQVNRKLKSKIEELHALGYIFAINDSLVDDNTIHNYQELKDFISYVKVDINTPKDKIDTLKSLGAVVIATKVETDDMLDKAKESDIKYAQGFFFSVPKILEQEKFGSNEQNVSDLCNKLMQDSSIDDIVIEFEKNPAITIQLLKFINSGAFHFRQNLSSIKQVLTLVGRTKLTQWLMLMMYANTSDDTQNSPLMEQVKTRSLLMENVSNLIAKDLSSEAYFVGVLSLMDVLFHVSLRAILKEMSIDKTIREALLHNRGRLGEIYLFVLSLEKFDEDEIEAFAKKNNISPEDLERLTLEASVA